MNTLTGYDEQEGFYKYLSLALIFHVILISITFGISSLFDLNLFKIDIKPSQVKVIQSSVRVDIVSMPKLTVQELKKMKNNPVEKIIKGSEVKKTSKDDIINPGDIIVKVKKKINLKDLLSNLSKNEKKDTRSGKERKKKISNDSKIQLQKLILEGNKVSQGTMVVGDLNVESDTNFNNYLRLISQYIKPFWKLPSYLMGKDFKCRIRVFIAANGSILRSLVYESSGSKEFDEKALSSLKNIKYFPKPGKDILPRVVAGEILLGFPL